MGKLSASRMESSVNLSTSPYASPLYGVHGIIEQSMSIPFPVPYNNSSSMEYSSGAENYNNAFRGVALEYKDLDELQDFSTRRSIKTDITHWIKSQTFRLFSQELVKYSNNSNVFFTFYINATFNSENTVTRCGQSVDFPCVTIQQALYYLDYQLNQNYSTYLSDTLYVRAVTVMFIILTDLEECYSQIVTTSRKNLVYNIVFQAMDGSNIMKILACDKLGYFPIIGFDSKNSYRKDIKVVLFKGLSLVLNHRGCQGYNFLFFDVEFNQIFLMINYNLFCRGMEISGDYIMIESSSYQERQEAMSGFVVYGYSSVYWIGVEANIYGSGIMFSDIEKFGLFQSKIVNGDLIFNSMVKLEVYGSLFINSRVLSTKIDKVIVQECEFSQFKDFSAIMADFGTSIEITNVKGTNGESFANIQGFASVTIEKLRLENNGISQYSKSVLQIEKSYEVLISSSVFLNNRGVNGSAIFLDGIFKLSITKCSFIGGISESSGGAILIPTFSRTYLNGMGQINNCIFENNTALSGFGGAIHVGTAYALNLLSNQFKNNRAYIGGGAVCIDEIYMQFQYSGSVFDGNSVMVVDHDSNMGGALMIAKCRFKPSKQDSVLWQSATFTNNFAKRGGAIAFLPVFPQEYGRFINSIFINNRALLSGAAIYIIGTEPIDENNVFIGNVLENNIANNVSYPIFSFESVMESNYSKVLTPGTEFTFKLKGVDYFGIEIPLDHQSISIISGNPQILLKTIRVGASSYTVIPYLLVNQTFYDNSPGSILQALGEDSSLIEVSVYFKIPLISSLYNHTVYISNCDKGYHIDMVPGNVGEYLYACVKDPQSYTYLIIGIVVPLTIVAFVMGIFITWVLIIFVRKIGGSLKRLREKDKAEEELEKKLNDKKIIFDLSDDEENDSHSKTSKKTSTTISTNGGDLFVPLLESSENQNFIIPIEDLTIEKKIGEGGNGVVYLGKWRNIKVAIKSIKSLEMNDQVDEFDKEAGILSRLHHLNIVQLYGVAMTRQNKYMVTEFLTRGSLDQIIYQCKNNILKLSFSSKLSILLDVANGMDYLHNMKPTIIHRDLKPGNILLNDQYQGKVCDFGLVRLIGNTIQSTMTMNIGTLMYLAPEAIDDSIIPKHDKKSLNIATKLDVYSFSIIMYEILFCIIPFIESPISNIVHKDVTTYKIPYLVSKGNRPYILTSREEIKNWVSTQDLNMYMITKNGGNNELIIDVLEKYQNLMVSCWNQSPLERPSFNDILHELLSLSKLL